MGSTFPIGALAYGSLYNTSSDVTLVSSGVGKINFTGEGLLLDTVANLANDELTVLTGGVYEVSMDLTATVIHQTNASGEINTIRFFLYVNEDRVNNSQFELSNSTRGSFVQGTAQVSISDTIGKTIQLELAANDKLSVRYEWLSQGVTIPSYLRPSMTVMKIAH